MTALMVAMALLGVIIVMLTRSQVQQNKAKDSISQSQSYKNLDSALNTEIRTLLQSLDGSRCIANSDLSLAIEVQNSQINLRHQTSVLKTGKDAEGNKRLEKTLASHSGLKAIQTRCSRPKFIGNSQVGNASQNHSYFCLELDPSQLTGQSVLGRAEYGLVEISLVFKDLLTLQAASCQAFGESNTAGAQVAYSIHWLRPEKDKFLVSSHHETFFTKK
ncbi:hypothetical protein [Pseudobacteriovorax antillogorgiicola]|nr:hypothetical protein [Pseudobacteriovorax antillogorgiicola]